MKKIFSNGLKNPTDEIPKIKTQITNNFQVSTANDQKAEPFKYLPRNLFQILNFNHIRRVVFRPGGLEIYCFHFDIFGCQTDSFFILSKSNIGSMKLSI